jgi:hypothetical protein
MKMLGNRKPTFEDSANSLLQPPDGLERLKAQIAEKSKERRRGR